MHRILSLPAFLLLLLPLFSCAQDKSSLNANEFANAIKDGNHQVLDVRTLEEYNTGHLHNVLLADWNDRPEFEKRIAQLDPKKTLYVYCLSGVRSASAASWLRKKGFQSVYHLDGGILSWKKAGLPLEAAEKVPQLSTEEYQSLIPTDKTVLVNIGASWCPPCRKMNPVVDSLAKTSNFTLVRIDGAQQTDLAKRLNVESFPFFIVYKQGKETWRKEGMVDAAELLRQLR